jgi:rubrerythrin
MTQDRNLKQLKTVAKKIARSKRIDHHEALNLVAMELGYTHWYALSAAAKNGWIPGSEDMTKATKLLEQINPSAETKDKAEHESAEMFGDPGGESQGQIGPHSYKIEVCLDEVYMSGRGWLIHVPEAPSKQPSFGVTDKRYKVNPIKDPDFVAQALEIANAKAEQVRARIASDWSRRSTKPDAQGRALHPIKGGLSDKWYCLHCDEQASAKAVARNLWHCPSCGASPIDIFSSPWWLDETPDSQSNLS